MSAAGRRAFSLLPRRRLQGTPFGTVQSPRRGLGSDVAGSRPYAPGDRLATIDWRASARLTAARGHDEFVVRQTFSDDTPRVVIVCDRSAAMALYPPGLPFVSKRDAVDECVTAIVASARAARAAIGWSDSSADDDLWLSPQDSLPGGVIRRRLASGWDAPPSGLARAVTAAVRHRTEAPPGTFLFVLSDFLDPPAKRLWQVAIGRGLDLVPVVIQDPIWESSFPPVGGVLVTIKDPRGGRAGSIRLTAAEAEIRRLANEERAQHLRDSFRRLGADPVTVSSAAAPEIDQAFAAWAARRRLLRRARTGA